MLQAVDWYGDGTVFVVDLALACCALESQSALDGRPAASVEAIPAEARVVLTLSGTLTEAMVPAVRAAIESLPTEPTVVAFGACAIAGGPYWDAYSVVKGAGELIEVDHFVAGCPPPPEAFAEVVEGVRVG